MFNIVKMTIMSGNFKPSEIMRRIKRLYAMGDISEAQMEELLALLVEKANPEMERPEMLHLIQTLAKKVDTLVAELEALKVNVSGGHISDDNSSEYPSWQPWDGLSDKYQPGSIVTHVGKIWISTFKGQNVWEPGTVGAQFWEEYQEVSA